MQIYELDHFYRGKLFRGAQAVSDFIITGCSNGLTLQESREIFDSVWRVYRTQINFENLTMGYALLDFNNESSIFLVVRPGQMRERGHYYPHYHCWIIPNNVRNALLGNMRPLLELAEQIPTVYEFDVINDQLVKQQIYPKDLEQQEEVEWLRSFLDYWFLQQLPEETLSAFADIILCNIDYQKQSLLLEEVPNDTHVRIDLMRSLLLLLPPSIRPSITFATQVLDEQGCHAHIKFLYQPITDHRNTKDIIYTWNTKKLVLDIDFHPYVRLLAGKIHVVKTSLTGVENLVSAIHEVDVLVRKILKLNNQDILKSLEIASHLYLLSEEILSFETLNESQLIDAIKHYKMLKQEYRISLLRNIFEHILELQKESLVKAISDSLSRNDFENAFKPLFFEYIDIHSTHLLKLTLLFEDYLIKSHLDENSLFFQIVDSYISEAISQGQHLPQYKKRWLPFQGFKGQVEQLIVIDKDVDRFLRYLCIESKKIYDLPDRLHSLLPLAEIYPSASIWLYLYTLMSEKTDSQLRLDTLFTNKAIYQHLIGSKTSLDYKSKTKEDWFKYRTTMIRFLDKPTKLDVLIRNSGSGNSKQLVSNLSKMIGYYSSVKEPFLLNYATLHMTCLILERLNEQDKNILLKYAFSHKDLDLILEHYDNQIIWKLAKQISEIFVGYNDYLETRLPSSLVELHSRVGNYSEVLAIIIRYGNKNKKLLGNMIDKIDMKGLNMTDNIEFTLQLNEQGASPEYIDDMTQSLADELRLVGVEDVKSVTQPGDPNTRSGDVITIGALLLVTLPPTIPAIIQFLQQWVLRDRTRAIKIRKQQGDKSIEIEISSDTDLKNLEKILRLVDKQIK